MRVNGEEKKLGSPVTLERYLKGENYNANRVAVEWNGQIIPNGEYAAIVLTEADTLEIVSFVGGG